MAGCHVHLVAASVLRLLRRRPVITQAVRFDDQLELRPMEVDLEPVDDDAGLRIRQPGLAGDA